MKKDIENITKEWKIQKNNNLNSDLLFSRIKEKKKKSNNRLIFSIGIAACLIITIGSVYFYNEYNCKNSNIFDGSNSDLICYTILMDCNYEK